jgi:pyruvate formate lyase activating enzyme
MPSKKFYQLVKAKEKSIICLACNHHCLIENQKTGKCGVRKNNNGQLNLLVDNKLIAFNNDPIEKKPLFHFLPGEKSFSISTLGCNFSCDFCQNWDISQTPKEQKEEDIYWGEKWPPQKIIDYCLKNKIKIIAYTYNEPTIWIEYALEIMKLAKKEKIKNVWVSNGYFSDFTLKAIAPYLDAVNIDFKSFSEEFYQNICDAHLEPVKNNIKKVFELGIWEEITTLIIPRLNDSDEELLAMAQFLKDISKDLVWHISAFYPAYKMINTKPTPVETILRAYNLGKKVGLNYVYTGNILNADSESTYCPNCQKMIIQRMGIQLIENKLQKNQCPYCGYQIAGVFD